MPKRLVPAVEAIYAFARSADDLADEGDADDAQRLADLHEYEAELAAIALDRPPRIALFGPLRTEIGRYKLPLQPFYDLLSAFKQDIVTSRYPDYPALLDYCSRSANPVGNLMLRLYGAADEANLRDSDAICSALQLINFLQDVRIDFDDKGRIYIPQDDLARFGVTDEQLYRQEVDANWRRLMQFEVDRARALMLAGAPLAKRLPGRIGWELRLVVQGGLRILEAIEQNRFDVFRRRPKLGPADWVRIVWRALWM